MISVRNKDTKKLNPLKDYCYFHDSFARAQATQGAIGMMSKNAM